MRYSLAVLALAVAVQASPLAFPGGVTSAIAPSAKPPPGCTPSHASFGIAVLNINTAAKQKRQVSTISDGQPQAPTSAAVVSTISDGQPQASQITSTKQATIGHISQITDGQIQAGLHTVTIMPVSQISDSQPQGPTVTYMPVSVISDGQPQAPKLPTKTACVASQIVMAATSWVHRNFYCPPSLDHLRGSATGTYRRRDAADATSSAPAASSTPDELVACKTPSSLEMSLSNGILTDSNGRTGYIAANYQFQFDKPPQAGAIYTAGFSICANGSLALGGSNVWWQCLSGDFYNLYDRDWAAQCSPITIESLTLVTCS